MSHRLPQPKVTWRHNLAVQHSQPCLNRLTPNPLLALVFSSFRMAKFTENQDVAKNLYKQIVSFR